MAQPRHATDVFGGRDALLERLADTVRLTREARGLSQQALADRAHEGGAADVAALEDRRQLPPKNVLLAYLDALGLPLQNVLPIRNLPRRDEEHWTQVMRDRKVALIAGDGGVSPHQAKTAEGSKWALELFLRMEALNELCPPAERVPDKKLRRVRTAVDAIIRPQTHP